MAVDPDEGSTRPGRLCSAGAHPDPERAVGNALAELGPLLAAAIRDHPGQRERAAAMVADADLVRTMDDHSVVNAHPAVAPRFDFLTRSTAVRDLRDVHRPAGMRGADLRTDLDALIGRYIDSDLDVVVVDQTTPEHRAGGFSCVKVIVPGTLSMTFGQRHRRTEGVPRLLRIPHRLGGRDRLLEPGDLNPHPHPFP
jgi:ribosomal protein S12 methylthiotransferase accessory factor